MRIATPFGVAIVFMFAGNRTPEGVRRSSRKAALGFADCGVSSTPMCRLPLGAVGRLVNGEYLLQRNIIWILGYSTNANSHTFWCGYCFYVCRKSNSHMRIVITLHIIKRLTLLLQLPILPI